MALLITLLLGVGNFAWHRAVIESGHRMVADMPPAGLRILRTMSLGFEFVLLCGALWAAKTGHGYWLWAYFAYSTINGIAAWTIVSGRV